MYRVMRTQIIRSLGVLSLRLLVALAGCFVFVEVSQAAVLSFVQKVPAGFSWKLWDSNNNAVRTLLVGREKPRQIFWAAEEAAAYFLLGDEVFRISLLERTPTPTSLGRLPKGSNPVDALWLEQKTRRIRIAAMQAVRGNVVDKLNGRTVFRMPDGAILPADDLPAWGQPHLVVVWEMVDKAGRWSMVERRATKSDAGDTPDLAVIADLRREHGHSNQALLRSYTCDNEQCRHDVPPALVRSASKLVGRSLNEDDLSLWTPESGGAALLFGTVMGDTLHITAPILLVEGDAKAPSLLKIGQRGQLGLGVHAGWLLIADESSGARPIVVDMQRRAIRFQPKQAFDAVWVPELR